MSVPLLFIDGQTVRELAPYPQLIDWVKQAMMITSSGDVELPQRWPMPLPGDFGKLSLMPGYLGGDVQCAGVKLVSLAEPHRRKGSSHLGLTVLYDADGIVPVAILCGATITAIRTAAASALASDVLARKDARNLTILGSGEQAAAHFDAFLHIREFENICIWGRSPEKAKTFVAERQAAFSGNLWVASSVEEAVKDADIICAVTASKTPVLFGADIKQGTHVNLVGSSFKEYVEADVETVVRSRFFVDYRPSTLAEGGEFLEAVASGAVNEDHILGEIGEVIQGKCIGRQTDDDITLYKSLGIASQDIITAKRIFEMAKEKGLGTYVDL